MKKQYVSPNIKVRDVNVKTFLVETTWGVLNSGDTNETSFYQDPIHITMETDMTNNDFAGKSRGTGIDWFGDNVW